HRARLVDGAVAALARHPGVAAVDDPGLALRAEEPEDARRRVVEGVRRRGPPLLRADDDARDERARHAGGGDGARPEEARADDRGEDRQRDEGREPPPERVPDRGAYERPERAPVTRGTRGDLREPLGDPHRVVAIGAL